MPHKAFVSSTFEDLKDHRAAVIEALREAGIHVDPMEEWTASSDEPKAFSQKRLKDCNLCILLVAFRRGHVPAGETLSITQLEYQAAREAGLAVHVFMLKDDEPWRATFDEREKDTLIEAWRKELREQRGVGWFGLEPESIKIHPALVRWFVESQDRPTTTRRPPSNIPLLGKQPFVGRDREFSLIRARLAADPPPRALVLAGPPGVGKSELAREYARRWAKTYAGGTFVVNCDGEGLPVDLATIGRTLLHRPMSGLSLEDQCLSTLYALGDQPTLLILDNARGPEAIDKWLPAAGQACQAIVTTNFGDWGAGFDVLELQPLDFDDSVELANRIGEQTGAGIPDRFTTALAKESGGLPMQICPQAAALAKDAARGRLNAAGGPMPLAPGQITSYRRAYDQLELPARLLLHAAAIFRPHSVPGEDCCRTVLEVVGGDLSSARRWLDACQDRYLITGQGELQMHQLLQDFVRGEKLDPSSAGQLEEIRRRQWRAFVGLARSVAENPADSASAQRVTAFVPDSTAWELVISGAPGKELHQIGSALSMLGQFLAARPWFERAVEAREKGDVHGRFDHQSLGSSLHQVGYCLANLGEFAAARPWFERAVEAAEKGDVHGRIDHTDLGTSLHHVGYCLWSLGDFVAARPWFERAVEAKEKGDVHSRIDHAGLGSSLHQVGACLGSRGDFVAARPWFERAIEAKEKGDVHSRFDHASLGRSLHQVGYCLANLGDFAAARPWFERAVEAKEKGDVHSRIDHESLGGSLHAVGYCLGSLGDFVAARPWFERAVEAAEKGDVYGRVNNDTVAGILRSAAAFFRHVGDSPRADEWEERARRLGK